MSVYCFIMSTGFIYVLGYCFTIHKHRKDKHRYGQLVPSTFSSMIYIHLRELCSSPFPFCLNFIQTRYKCWSLLNLAGFLIFCCRWRCYSSWYRWIIWQLIWQWDFCISGPSEESRFGASGDGTKHSHSCSTKSSGSSTTDTFCRSGTWCGVSLYRRKAGWYYCCCILHHCWE